MKNNIKNNQSGAMLVIVLVIAGLFFVIASGLITLGLFRQKLYNQQIAKHQALHVAEAGINYYVWHLAHAINDYYDNTGADPGEPGIPHGPYEHDFVSSTGEVGTYSLMIYPPETGSTIVTIEATGRMGKYPLVKRTIKARYGLPTLAKYSFLANTNVWFGKTESTIGEVHSNGGIRMDGLNNSSVKSSRDTYICPSNHGCSMSSCKSPCTWVSGTGCRCPAVWGSGSGSSFWSYPVPTVDFNAITTDIADLRLEAMSNGIYLGTAGSSNQGYHAIFKTDGTFDVYTVNTLKSAVRQLNDDWSDWADISEEINTETFFGNYDPENNSVIYFEDDLWIEGTVNGRYTVVAATLPDNPSDRKSVTINNNLTYTALDGNHILGLISQNNIKVPKYAPTDLKINATLLAQNGRVFRNYYYNHLVNNSIEIFGGIITNKTWTWSWTSGSATIDGYRNTKSTYDSLATYSPPPFFPNTGEYEFISWEEK